MYVTRNTINGEVSEYFRQEGGILQVDQASEGLITLATSSTTYTSASPTVIMWKWWTNIYFSTYSITISRPEPEKFWCDRGFGAWAGLPIAGKRGRAQKDSTKGFCVALDSWQLGKSLNVMARDKGNTPTQVPGSYPTQGMEGCAWDLGRPLSWMVWIYGHFLTFYSQVAMGHGL